jgi:N-acetylglutamate synthase-like GNAT family acetyltransferase
MYVADAGKLPTFAIEESGCVIGFLTLREHFLFSWEVHCMAIQSADRGKGLGSKLLAHSESWLVKQGVKFLQVKTVAATAKSTEYAETRKFYE